MRCRQNVISPKEETRKRVSVHRISVSKQLTVVRLLSSSILTRRGRRFLLFLFPFPLLFRSLFHDHFIFHPYTSGHDLNHPN